MSKYYCLIAGLPNIALDDSKLPYTVAHFKEELKGILSCSDQRLVDLLFLKYDNKNLLRFIENPDSAPDERGNIAYDTYNEIYQTLKEEEKPKKNKSIPPYMDIFLKQYIQDKKDKSTSHKPHLLLEDRLSALYYDYAMRNANRFVASWFELNLNINNMLTAITCRKYKLDKSLYIVGDNEIAQMIRSSNARDFGLGDMVDYLPELQKIAEESDLMVREKKVDLLKWKWLDENTFFKTFDIESVISYLLQLEMIERWVTLDKEKGEKNFRAIVKAMKHGSENALDEFKRNNDK